MLKRSLSTDSWDSPWETKRKRRPTVVPQNQSGRNVNCASFLMCFISVLLLSCGLILLGISVWSLVRKIPYGYLMDIKVDVPYFTIPAACICFPCFWISMAMHDNRKNFEFFHLLILLLIMSVALLVTGSSLGFIYFGRNNVNTSGGSMIMAINTNDLKNLLQITMFDSDKNINYEIGWNKIQAQLNCCGTSSYKDWLNFNRSIPSSCCNDSAGCTVNNIYARGCLKHLKRDLIWHLNILNCLCYMVIVIQVMAIILAATLLYLKALK